jgi:energy-coupling factor transporter ATP-binding protein EcfA2
MTAAEDLSEGLYLKLIDHISTLLKALARGADDPSLASAQADAQSKLQEIEQALIKAINELKYNAEHKTFTVAFYGETNAGKSTLIETLRILLKENTKREQRQRFFALQQSGLSEEALQALEIEIESLGSRLAQSVSETAAADARHDQRQVEQQLQEGALRARIEEQKRSAGLIQRILNLLRKLPEDIALVQLQAGACVLPVQREAELTSLRQQGKEIQKNLGEARQRHATALDSLQQLAAFEDGSIIGDGRADFTRQTQAYSFDSEGQHFQLLDVPGIEGNESKVSAQINNAVKRAHAVFYVTSKAAPPQTGDTGRPGTLEKIKAQLGAQTEVWTLYNKRITNPMALQKPDLISADEQASLDDLDQIMRKQLGEHYQRSMTLCALPAFYAAADCLVPRSTIAISRKKFLDAMAPEALLEKSGVKQFYRHLTRDLVTDVKAKIRRSNMNKVQLAVTDVCAEVKGIQVTQFAPLAKKLNEEAESACHQLQIAFKSLNSGLSNAGEQVIGEFEDAVRRRVYDKIDEDISNDDFKAALERVLKSEQSALQDKLPAALDKQVDQFQRSVGEIVQRFEAHAKDLLASYSQIGKARLAGDFSLNVSIDNGINVVGLLASLAGGAVMIWNPVGWVLMTIGVATLLVGLAKAVWSFFDSDYKKGQQRKATDNNLYDACEAIRSGFRETLAQALPPLEEKIEQIRTVLQQPALQARHINQKLDAAHLGLKKIASDLKA